MSARLPDKLPIPHLSRVDEQLEEEDEEEEINAWSGRTPAFKRSDFV